ncbi:hypothetical protein VM1G_02859 [Cytospora mali]|uniref:DUF7924 domain-containing protein n=1 Tax=Cytospora mali TaxID=578113 RepID=A0A194VU58_CYTMA|nr:hypothetical protein VM1G_02859 [Valsa mali]
MVIILVDDDPDHTSAPSHSAPGIVPLFLHTSPASHPHNGVSAGGSPNRKTEEDEDGADGRSRRQPNKRRRLSIEDLIQDTEAETETSPDKSRAHLYLEQAPRRQTSRGYDLTWHREAGSPAKADSQYKDVDFDPVEYWAREGRWPSNLSLQEMEDRPRDTRSTAASGAQGALVRQKVPSIRSGRKRARSESDDGSASDQATESRDGKSTRYRSSAYETLLESKNRFLRDDARWVDADSAKAGRSLVRTLLHIATDPSKAQDFSHPAPRTTLFADHLFNETCRRVAAKNEARVVRDILPLIVPPAEFLAIHGAMHLNKLVEGVNESWDCAQPLVSPRPQPDYSAGFTRDAFTQAQLGRLAPYIGDGITPDRESLFMGTRLMHFPFLTCEVRCGDQTLAVADRQNAHSMTLAVRGVVELFRLVGREKELDHRVLALSFSHDDSNVRIYGHYPVIDKVAIGGGQETAVVKYYRHKIHAYDFTVLDGRDKWTAYRIVRYIYDEWMPRHLATICSAIDQLPVSAPLFDPLQESAQAPNADRAEPESAGG